MSRIVVIVGGSTTGKTELAYKLARVVGAATVVCGDQYQIVGGFPIATGIIDSAAYGDVKRELYGILPATTDSTLSDAEYGAYLDNVLACHPNDLVIIDGLSVAYFSVLAQLRERHDTIVLGLRPHWATPLRVLQRMWKAWRGGIVPELRSGGQKYGEQCWYYRNSFVAQAIAHHGLLIAMVRILWTGLTGEAIRGKHRRILASDAVDVWL